MLTSHSLPSLGQKSRRRRGRGNASGRGNYSGRGIKGQRARSGGKGGLFVRGLKQTFLRIPKTQGFQSPYRKPQIVNIDALERKYASGALITPATLYAQGLIRIKKGDVKILGRGLLTKALTVHAHYASESAIAKITKAGGLFEPL